jgi:hypothetical protein
VLKGAMDVERVEVKKCKSILIGRDAMLRVRVLKGAMDVERVEVKNVRGY